MQSLLKNKAALLLRSFAVLLVGLVVCSQGVGQTLTTYRLTDLGDLPGGPEESWGHDINAEGNVVGMSKVPTFAEAPYFWSPETGIIGLGTLPGGYNLGEAFGINDSNQVTGKIATSTGMKAFVWDQVNGMKDIGWLPGGYDVAVGHHINNLGNVVGHSYVTGGGAHAYLWTPTNGMLDLGLLPGHTQDFSTAESLNDLNMVVGRGASPTTLNHAFYWDNTTGIIDIGTFGGEASYAWDINNQGEVVGAAEYNKGSPSMRVTHAFRWTLAGGKVDLGIIPSIGDFSEATGINNKGVIVGFCRYPTYIPVATVWKKNIGWKELNRLMDASGAGYDIFDAQAINDNGQIAATAYTSKFFKHAVRLTPNNKDLFASAYAVSDSEQKKIKFTLYGGPQHANDNYLLLAGASGATPGTPLPGGLVLPLNWDVVTNLVPLLNNKAVFFDFMGQLDGIGEAYARFEWPGQTGSVGVKLTFAYLCQEPSTGAINFVSSPVEVEVTP